MIDMNYIKQLESDNARLRAQIDKMDDVLHEMYNYVNSAKYQGVDSRDGSLNNYVNTGDITDRIRQVMPFRNNFNEV